MQLPTSTVPSDSNAFAQLIPGASTTSTDESLLSTPTAGGDTAEFDQLFAELTPCPKPEAPKTPGTDVAPDLMVCMMPFMPAALVADGAPQLGIDANADENVAVDTPQTDDVCGFPIPSSPADEFTPSGETRDSRGVAVRTTKANARSSQAQGSPAKTAPHSHAAGNPAVPAGPLLDSDRAPAASEPNEHASDRAFQTPRFAGLPAAALEHRTPQTTPPGLARLMAAHESPEAAVPASATNEVIDSAVPLEIDESAAFVAPLSDASGTALLPRPANWRGMDSREQAENVLPETSSAQRSASSQPALDDVADPVVRIAAQLTEKGRPEPKAKFAAARATVERPSEFPTEAPKKSFVAPQGEALGTGRKSVGTDVAKPAPTMSAHFLPTPNQHPASEYAAVAIQDAAGGMNSLPDSPAALIASTAHEAVEVVLKTVEQASAQQQKSVNLQFSVGDADLSVRVQLHANEVRTTFRTDSSELRAALSHEWGALAASASGDRTMRMVPAFVTASEHSAFNAFAGDTPSRQRDHAAERGSRERSVVAMSRSRGAVTAAAVATPASGAASITSRHLQTVA